MIISQSAVELARKVAFKKGEARALNNIGTIHHLKGNYPEAFKYLYEALRIFEESGDEMGVAQVNNNLGNTYNYLGEYEKAKKCLSTAIDIKRRLGDKNGVLASYQGLGNAYGNMKDYKEAMRIFNAGLKEATELGLELYIALACNNLGYYGAKMGNYEQAIADQSKAVAIFKRMNREYDLGISYANIANCYLHLKNYEAAEKNATEGLKCASAIGDLEGIRECKEYLSIIYENTGRYEKALTTYKEFVAAKDSLANEENTKETVRHEMNYEFEKKEAAAKLEQEKREAVAAAESRKQKIIISSVSAILVLVFVFALFAYRSYLQKQRANKEITQQKHLIEEKQKEILDSIHYAKRIQTALMPHDKYIERNLKKLRA